MPAYNCERYVNRAIDGILSQTYSHFELLIADDCSKDRTKELINAYSDPRIKCFHNDVNLGYLKASNKLFKQCNGEYITFQDADDYSNPERLSKLVDFLETNQGISCVGSNVIKVSPDGEEFGRSNFPLDFSSIKKSFENYRTVFTGSALMVRKAVVNQIGIYNEYFDRIGSEDIYWYSLMIEKFQTANLAEPLYYYRANPHSVTSTHRNPKAFVGHDLILFFYQRRKEKKKDFIGLNQWKKSDDCAWYFISINAVKKGRWKGTLAFIKMVCKAPLFLPTFFRKFAREIKLSFN